MGRLLAPSYSRSLHTTPVLSAIQLNMPSLSPTMEEGTIVKWHKVRMVVMVVMMVMTVMMVMMVMNLSRPLVTPWRRGT